MVELVRAGLATATPQCVSAGSEVMEVATLRITGRKAAGGDAAMKCALPGRRMGVRRAP
jgi:hypothetical protein